jgi:penicillin-binding protein 1A
MAKVAEMAGRLGVMDNMQQTLAMSIGAGETTVLKMVSAYSMIVNGGKKIEPTFIDRVQDGQGWTIYRHDQRKCDGCAGIAYDGQPPPELPDERPQVLDPMVAYQMVSLMEGVVRRGTGSAVSKVGKPLAGKTGTTNDGRDVWFVGFSPDLAAGVYIGFDQPRTLGEKATGGTLSAPIFRDFMLAALKDKPATPFRVPPGIRLVRVNYKTGQRVQPGEEGRIIWEAFRPGTEPNGAPMQIVEGDNSYSQDAGYGSVIPLESQMPQQATDSLPQDTATSILDMPEQAPQVSYTQPLYGAGEGSNPADYHPTNVAPPGVGTKDAAPNDVGAPASSETITNDAAPNQVGEVGTPPPLPNSVDQLNSEPAAPTMPLSNEDLTRPLDPALGGTPPTQPPAQAPAPAPADSSGGLY